MKGILIPAIVENIGSRKDNTLKITLGTNELPPDNAGALFALHNKLVTVYISPSQVNTVEIEQVDKLDPELQGKTQGQRIRNVLFLLFQQDTEGFKSFDEFYKFKTERIIEHLKTKIK